MTRKKRRRDRLPGVVESRGTLVPPTPAAEGPQPAQNANVRTLGRAGTHSGTLHLACPLTNHLAAEHP